MAFVIKGLDRVQETTTSLGSPFTLAGAVTGFDDFSQLGDGNSAMITVAHDTADEWITFIGTYTAAGTTIAIDTVHESSNGDAAVVFSAGDKFVFVSQLSNLAVSHDDNGNVALDGNLTLAGAVDGRDVALDGTKLDGIEAGADVTDATNVNASGATMNTDFLAKGSVLAASAASTPVSLAVGADDEVLTADAAEATGMKWAAAGAGTMAIGGTVTGATTGSVLFVAAGPVLAQDNTGLFFDPSTDMLGIGTASPLYSIDIQSTDSQLLGIEADSNFARFQFTSYRNNAGTHCLFVGKAARDTKASPSHLLDDDSIFSIRAGSQVINSNSGTIDILADGGHGAGSTPGKILFRTTPSGATIQVTRMVIKQDGFVGIGTEGFTPDRLLHVEQERSVTNAVSRVFRITSTSSGTPAAGIGVGMEFEAETSASNNEVLARIDVEAVDVTSTSEDGSMFFTQMVAGSTTLVESLRLEGNSISFYGATPVAQASALTTQDTSITHTAPGTPDFAIQDLIDSGAGSAFGFATKDEGNTVLQVILNLQTRVAELEAALDASTGVGLIA